MYPGVTGDGIAHPVLPGVTVVVGTNGIGKTTLLNILLHVLTGPYRPNKADLMRPGSGRHRRTKLSSFNYFANRVGHTSANATATLVVAFGEHESLSITRKLSNLKLTALIHNGRTIERADEQRYLDLAIELSGTQSDWDYDFLIRSALFFLEDKAPLLWSDEGQFELLRILFLDPALSAELVALRDEIFQLDSQIRNEAWHLAETSTELTELRSLAPPTKNALTNSLPVLEARLAALTEQIDSMDEDEQDKIQVIDRDEKLQFELEQKLDNARQQLAHREQEYFSRAFPSLPIPTQLVLGRLLANDACLVCGSDAKKARAKLLSLQKQGACPVCETPDVAADGTGVITKTFQSSLRRLESAEAMLANEYGRVKLAVTLARTEFDGLKRKQRGLWQEQAQLSARIADLRAKQRPATDRVSQLHEKVKSASLELKSKRSVVTAKRKKYAAGLRKAHVTIAGAARRICTEFHRFSTEFLGAECSLEFEMASRRVGEIGGRIEFPHFTPKVASAMSALPTTRESAGSVSESQKEFLDLAFRMAVMRTAAMSNTATMLVVETPEASLDSLFIERAGRMLRDYTFERGRVRHTVIASSNLNLENMIPALLGLSESKGRAAARKEAPKRIIDLLEIAAKSPVVKRNLARYRGQLRQALHGT